MLEFKTLQENVHQICYALYRYEIKSGLSLLESTIPEISRFLSQQIISEENLRDINQLLQMIFLAVEKKDFIVAADLLKYEFLEGKLLVASSSAVRRES
ncbi:hypothetical protein LOZ80_32090 [Paenibacillus sp. HWE-109]|uniref:hypothetical protein n=1 Tax=Paenibacillus sp. HWE-109 TaxID=1306526 RepID=UPI001EDD146D|nr:hypothetical protein [Paenibacillus sp. HWE-109]UKS26139.1 hypothetical protein LOZ80_32090 [Paenibacillus sp. HWE-109]